MQIIDCKVKEKRICGDWIQSPLVLAVQTYFWGLAMGVLLSLSTKWFYFHIRPDEVMIVWCAALFFSCFGFRFLCFSYAIGLISLLHLIVMQFRSLQQWLAADSVSKVIVDFSLIDWLWLGALLHICEWLLIRFDGLSGRQIITADHQLGYQVNGYLISRAWPIPCIVFTTTGWIPVPMLIGFASYNLSKPIHQQKRLASTFTLLHAIILAIACSLAPIWSASLWFASLWALTGHELIFRYQKWREKRLQPLFVSDQFGLKILEVIPHSPAAKLGIRPGYILQEANDVSIHTNQDLEKVTKCSAHCKLKLLDSQFDHHFLQKAIYADDPKHLGIIGAVSLNEVAVTKEEEDTESVDNVQTD